jgi:sterol desaturase/sphingolipid hydroxylase (fatty acid hydroxylase superfamily)
METVTAVLIPASFVAMLVAERVFPGRPLPKVRGWLLKCLACFLVALGLNTFIPALLASALARHAPLHLGALGAVLGGVVGFVAIDIVSYGVHRLLHTVPLLWRWTHQFHHSAERVDIAGGAYFHPLDLALQIATTTCAALLLGLGSGAAALAGYLSFVLGFVQHLNVRTPQWLGWIIQRPEAHALHHARGVHAYNYGTIMVWDILFGTFRNPATFTTEPAGFWDGASREVGPMLLGRDVSEHPNGGGR